MIQVLNNLNAEKKVLIILAEEDQNVILSARNIPGVATITANSLNVLDILNANKVVITQDAVRKIEEVLA
ncbi:MAG: 50S ribosomal protein L4, partial [Bacilli bacterium]|nr:50S ribosomal protein L4 [Bacilli bacterium]